MHTGSIKVSMLLASLLLAAVSVSRASDFDDQLARHFKAVSGRDLATLEKTLTAGNDLELIFPDGTRTTTRAQYVDFHREWFTSKTWKMSFEPISKIETPSMAVATVRTRYEDVEDGKPILSQSWLTLVFRNEQGRWSLVHDQNTRVKKD